MVSLERKDVLISFSDDDGWFSDMTQKPNILPKFSYKWAVTHMVDYIFLYLKPTGEQTTSNWASLRLLAICLLICWPFKEGGGYVMVSSVFSKTRMLVQFSKKC